MLNKAYNSEDYAIFLEQLFDHFDAHGIETAYLILDNVHSYWTEEVTRLISSRGRMAVFCLPIRHS